MNVGQHYDCAVIGGGLAGLSLSIQLAREGFKVVLFEKESYPFHKVCGEYVSMESFGFLEDLGCPLHDWQLPVMNRLMVSTSSGNSLISKLPLGGFGLSRYRLDAVLAEVAKQSGVIVLEQVKVSGVTYDDSLFYVGTANGIFKAPVCCGAFGKRSNLDVRWNREFTRRKNNELNNFIGVKYHALLDHPRDMIALHHFHNGYCGISAIEENKYCICYLTIAENLRQNRNDIRLMEHNILYKNHYLKRLLSSARHLYKVPLTISQISFDKKQQIENHVLMTGDAAGMITPLCGNGMCMALHGSKIAAKLVSDFLYRKISRSTMERQYEEQWQRTFHRRLCNGRVIQRLFAHEMLLDIFINAIRPFPVLVGQIVQRTHGRIF